MGIGLVTNEGSVAVKEEVTEGTYVAEAAAGDFVEVLNDGLEFTPTRELLERNNRTSTIEQVPGRLGQKSMAGTVPVELKSGPTSVAGHQPETHSLWRALLGASRQRTTNVTTKTGNTASVLQIEDADIASFSVGDIVTIKESGAFHTSPISAVDPTASAANITLVIAGAGAFSDNVVIEQFTTYYHASGHPTLSITNYLGGEIREKAIGMRCVSGELSNFVTGQLPSMAFGVEGLDFDREVGTPLFTPSFDDSLPPVTLGAKVYQNGVLVDVNEVSLSIANSLGFLTSTASKNGKISSRITELAVTGTFNPYMQDDDVDTFDLFNKNEPFSLFLESKNFTNDDCTEWNESVAFWLPNCRVSELATGDADGILTDAITFAAYKTLGSDTIFVSMA